MTGQIQGSQKVRMTGQIQGSQKVRMTGQIHGCLTQSGMRETGTTVGLGHSETNGAFTPAH